MTDALPQIEIGSPQALHDWLARNHGQAQSVWLVTWKKAHPDKYVSRDEVLDALIAWGWIDGRRKTLDDARTMQLIAQRSQQIWAESYRARAERLENTSRMMPPGRAAIDAAKQAGLWRAWDDVDALEIPGDLATALDAQDGTGWFDAVAPSYRRNVLRWLRGAKRPETRARRADSIARHAAQGEKLPHY